MFEDMNEIDFYYDESHDEYLEDMKYLNEKWIPRIKARKVGLGKIPKDELTPEIISMCIQSNPKNIIHLDGIFGFDESSKSFFVECFIQAGGLRKNKLTKEIMIAINLYPGLLEQLNVAMLTNDILAEILSKNNLSIFHIKPERKLIDVVGVAYHRGMFEKDGVKINPSLENGINMLKNYVEEESSTGAEKLEYYKALVILRNYPIESIKKSIEEITESDNSYIYKSSEWRETVDKALSLVSHDQK